MIYNNFSSTASEDKCPICLDWMKGKDAVAHENGGDKHPLCRECAKTAALVNRLCPFCRAPIDPTSLCTWQETCIIELKEMGKDALYGLGYGISLAGLWGPIFASVSGSSTMGGLALDGVFGGEEGIRVAKFARTLEEIRIPAPVEGIIRPIGMVGALAAGAAGAAVGLTASAIGRRTGAMAEERRTRVMIAGARVFLIAVRAIEAGATGAAAGAAVGSAVAVGAMAGGTVGAIAALGAVGLGAIAAGQTGTIAVGATTVIAVSVSNFLQLIQGDETAVATMSGAIAASAAGAIIGGFLQRKFAHLSPDPNRS